MSFFRNLFGKARPVFTPLERQILSAVQGELQGEAASIFARQVESVNLVQRHGGSREVNCYHMEGRRPRPDPGLRFPDRAREREMAEVRFRAGGKSWRATLILVEGFFFSIVFDRPAEAVQEQEPEITAVKVLHDPMTPAAPLAARPMAGEPRFSGWLAEWAARHELAEVLEPLPPGTREQRIAEIPAKLPADYLALTEQTDGFVIGDCKVFGLAAVYGISLDEDYHVIAEIDGRGVLAVEAGPRGRVFFLDYDEGVPRIELPGFREGMETCLAGGLPAGSLRS